MRRGYSLVTTPVIVLTLLLSACAATGGESPAGESTPATSSTDESSAPEASTDSSLTGEIPIGVPVCLEGPLALVGAQLKKGAELAIEEVNEGFLGEATFVPYFEENEGDPAKGPTVMELLINGTGVSALAVGCSTGTVQAEGPIAEEAGIPYVHGNAVGPDVGTIGDYIFRTSMQGNFLYESTAKAIGEAFPSSTASIVFGSNDPSLVAAADDFERYLTEEGIEIVAREGIASFEEADFSAVVTKIQPLNADLVAVILVDTQAANFMVQARRGGIESQFVGHSGHSTPNMFDTGGEAVVGEIFGTHWSVDADHPTNTAFIEAYRAKYDEDPDLFAANGYAPIWTLAKAIRAADSAEPADIQAALAAMGTTDVPHGVDGVLTFDENGDARIEGVIVQIQDDGSFAIWEP
jgi:branched-chain amino acid transport system substrate-binding protein